MTGPQEKYVRRSRQGSIAIVALNRPEKRNALSQRLFVDLEDAFDNLEGDIRAVVLHGLGDHFCAGLDLSEHQNNEPFSALLQSRKGHRIFDKIRNCDRPVISVLHGAVIGGGLELACSTHIRVADATAFFQLPEGRRGIFLGGGGSVSVARVIGTDRLIEMMLTGRRIDAELAERLGLSHYLVASGDAFRLAMEIAENVSHNAPISNYMMLNALNHIGDMSPEAGLFAESLAQAVTLTNDDAKNGIQAFLDRKKIKF